MDRIYVINYEYANEKICLYERGAKCAFTDLNKAKERLAELTEGLKDEMLERLDEDDIVEEKRRNVILYLLGLPIFGISYGLLD